ncbi:MAG TPA: outer membrane beta-barrel protein [Kiritimatiellia bacterium]|nr:outer membrane beta-barrel protein [Kiritimatiellia bacterium]
MDQGGPLLDPFYLPVRQTAVLPRLTLLATREDNVFLDNEGESAGTFIDLIPGVMAIYGRPEHNHLHLDTGAIIPLKASDEDIEKKNSYFATLGGVLRNPKSQLALRAGYRRMEQVDTLVGARIVKEELVGNAAWDVRTSGKTRVGVLGTVEDHQFDEESYTDYRRIYGAGRLYYQLTPKSEGFAQVGAGRDDLRDADVGDADFLDASVGVRGRQSPKLAVGGRVGYQWRDVEAQPSQTLERWIASLNADWNPKGLSQFSAELVSDVRPAIQRAGVSTVNQRLTLGVNRRLFVERVRGNGSIYFGRVEYKGEDARFEGARAGSVFDGREDEYWGYSLGLEWWVRRNLSIAGGYAYSENRGSRNADETLRQATSFESGVWSLRVSWNY